MKPPKYLYHATYKKNRKAILEQGLIPFFPAVYMTNELRVAKWFVRDDPKNAIIFRVKTENLDPEMLGQYNEMLCTMLKTEPFWHYYETIPPSELEIVT